MESVQLEVYQIFLPIREALYAKSDAGLTLRNVLQRFDDFSSERQLENILRQVCLFLGVQPLSSSHCKLVHELLSSALDQTLSLYNPDQVVPRIRSLLRPRHIPKSALIIVDVQNDFISGSLALSKCSLGENGNAVVPVINTVRYSFPWDLIVISKDWHPSDHVSFFSQLTPERLADSERERISELKPFDEIELADGLKQTLWPDHCIAGSSGAELHRQLKTMTSDVVVHKGTQSDIDSYSAFWDNGRKKETELSSILKQHEIVDVYSCGLAYDVCVGLTAQDAVTEGFRSFVIENATRSISADSKNKMKEQLAAKGVSHVNSRDFYVRR